MSDPISLQPIGIIHTPFRERYLAPLQAEEDNDARSEIILNAHCNYETALRDLESFSHIWVIWWFHEAQSWKPVIQTPRDGSKHGVFATRSPHRPNPIAISAVRLHGVEGRTLHISGADMVDGTPVLDLKPYIAQHDSFPDATAGWTASAAYRRSYSVAWSPAADERARFISELSSYDIAEHVQRRLLLNPFPTDSNRIEALSDGHFLLSSRAWRILYQLDDTHALILDIRSSYDFDSIHRADLELNSAEAHCHHSFLRNFS